MKKNMGLKRERATMRYFTQKLVQKNVDPRKVVWGNVTLKERRR